MILKVQRKKMNYQNSNYSHRPNKTVMIVFPTKCGIIKLTNAVNSISKTFLSVQNLLDKIVSQNVFIAVCVVVLWWKDVLVPDSLVCVQKRTPPESASFIHNLCRLCKYSFKGWFNYFIFKIKNWNMKFC